MPALHLKLYIYKLKIQNYFWQKFILEYLTYTKIEIFLPNHIFSGFDN